jgi:hypothetical protein
MIELENLMLNAILLWAIIFSITLLISISALCLSIGYSKSWMHLVMWAILVVSVLGIIGFEPIRSSRLIKILVAIIVARLTADLTKRIKELPKRGTTSE